MLVVPSMRFHVYSREQMDHMASNWFPPRPFPHALISIISCGDPEPRLPQPSRGFMRLVYDDIGDEPFGALPLDHWPFIIEQARQVVAFARSLPADTEAILVHCAIGMSRSHATAAALAKGVYGQDDSWHFLQGAPNPRVYRLILEACAC